MRSWQRYCKTSNTPISKSELEFNNCTVAFKSLFENAIGNIILNLRLLNRCLRRKSILTKLRYLVILVLTASVGLVLGCNVTGQWLIHKIGDTALNSREGTLTVLLVLLSCFIFAVILMPIIYGIFDKS